MGLLRRKEKVGKATPAEQKKVTARLQKKYPQMYEPGGMTKSEREQYSTLSKSDKKALKGWTGLKLKRKYRKK